MINGIKNICVFGASSSKIASKYTDAAYQLGRLLANENICCINGAGREGIMRAVSDGVLDANGKVIGIIPQFMVDNGWQYDRLSEIMTTPDMHTRKSLMAERSDAIVAMPGGCGTMEELMEIITWRQLGLFKGLIIIFNVDGYYNDLLNMLSRSIQEDFMKSSHANLWKTASDAIEVIHLLKNSQSDILIETKY